MSPSIQAAYQAPAAGAAPSVQVFDARDLPWLDTPEPGLRLKPVRYDNNLGHFLGLVGFLPMTRSGLHQHRGVATSFVIDGCLHDYFGAIGLHQAGINLVGATHDAMAYQNTVLVSRLEGPVVYPPARTELSGLHAGSTHAEFDNPAPDAPPELNITVDQLVPQQTGFVGIRRQGIFDYSGTGSDHRFVQLALAPGAVCPAWQATAAVDFWVRGGTLHINGQTVHANCFVVIEPGAWVEMASPFGALLLAWAEGAEHLRDTQHAAPSGGARAVRSSLFGF
jgi:hypothetical protein